MIEITVKNGRTGYDVIADYILRYWGRNVYEDVIVSIGTSYDGKVYSHYNEIASPCFENGECVEYLNDWWEGEEHVRLFGIKPVSAFNVTGGIYEDN